MKKIFLLFLLFGVCIGTFSQTRNVGIGIIADGTDILTGTNQMLQGSDVEWSVKLVKNDCIVKDEDCVFGPWIDAYDVNKLMLAFDLNEFTFPCGAWAVGDLIEVSIEVVNPGHPFAGYKGKTIFAAPQVERDYWGEEGINIVGAPELKIEVYDTTLCASLGQIIPAIVRNAPEGYQVLWPDSRLSPLPGDKALVGTSFSADSTYQLSAILTDKNGLPLDTAFFELAFDTLPGVDIVEDNFCLAAGEPLLVNGIIPANSTHQWISTEPQMLSRTPGSVPTSYSTVMPDRNVKVTLTATSALTGCSNSDSVFIYLRPDKPLISIDTNTTRNNLKISWNADEKVSDYTLWSNKWDAYGIEKPYSQRATLAKEITSYTISTAELDTLEFFYLMGENNPVCPAESDTVGYYKQTIYGKNIITPAKGTNNVISYPFDMSDKGIKTDRDLHRYLIDLRILNQDFSIAWYDFSRQAFRFNNYIGDWDVWDGAEFDVKVGDCYMLCVSGIIQESTILMYGKLKRWDYSLQKSSGASYNLICLPFEKMNLKNSEQIAVDLGGLENISGLQYWDFASQSWKLSVFERLPIPGRWTNIFNINPGKVLFVDVKNNTLWP